MACFYRGACFSKVQSQEVTYEEMKSKLERLRATEEQLAELKHSKLSPFVQAEVLERIDRLEVALREQSRHWNVKLEELRLDYKLDAIRTQHITETAIPHSASTISAENEEPLDQPDEDEIENGPETERTASVETCTQGDSSQKTAPVTEAPGFEEM